MTGRPRDPAVDDAIRAAVTEIVERDGYRGLSMEGIAALSGVSKQTVYRRYRSKGEVVLDTLGSIAATRLPTPDTGSLLGDLTLLLTATFEAQRTVSGTLNRAVAAEALQDPEFAALLRERLIDVRRTAVREMLARGRERGEVVHPDDDHLIDLVFGPMWYRLLFDVPSLTWDYAAELARSVTLVASGGRLRDGGGPGGGGRS
ncbi:TetR/AcrR family transcriptional regulator [Kitasatospora sp. NPDC047058]|uniref:TetR/AcrR family transcriptional regulator n=1 Tax=Kitasatospora sp. NPDC047058 TaxID=3155620 RepID=UPI0033E880F9